MNTFKTLRPHRIAAALALLATLAGAARAGAQTNPDFDAVSWRALGCPAADLTSDTSPGAVNFVGNATFPAAYYAFDASYLYFRYRMDRDPAGSGGFAQFAWTALMQVESGNPFQYQYQVSLEGSTDDIEIWHNTVASDIDFSPLFHDDSEVKLFSQPYKLANGSTVNTTPLARRLATGDGSNFGNDTNYFVDFAVPVSALIGAGAITNANDLAGALFFPATSTNGNNYNKGHLNCPFLPTTDVAVVKAVEPVVVPANATTGLTYTILTYNAGLAPARGLVIDDIALPAFMTNPGLTVTSNDPAVTWTVVTANPLQIKVGNLPVGANVTIELATDATPSCSDADFMNIATATAINAMDDVDTALLDVQTSDGFELCDGADNDCDGTVDEDTSSACSDGDACNGAESCVAGSCQPGTALDCNDANDCTSDACDAASGCVNTSLPDGTSCSDGDACTQTDTCAGGSCLGASPVVCAALDQCHTAGACDPATGACSNPVAAEGTSCSDGDACTQSDACTGGSCVGANPVVCAAADQCHTAGTCDPATGQCSDPVAADGSSCSDGDACTTGDTCQTGGCTAGTPVVCNALDQCHTAGVCDSATGECSNPTLADGTTCDDTDACTQTDSCTGGSCVGTNPVVCTALDQCHTAGTCDSGTGVCSNPTVLDGTACDDGQVCSSGDACQGGSCTSTPIPGCVPCTTASDCSDGNVCSVDVCTAAGICDHVAMPGCRPCTTAGDCDDDNPCTTDQCGGDHSCAIGLVAGCEPCTTVADCNDGNSCTTDSCVNRVCRHDEAASCDPTPVEQCGNCLDDDGDGLVDAEDPDCCSEPMALELRGMRLRQAAGKKPSRFRMRARYAAIVPAGFDPMTADSSLQIADANGQVFCQTVGAPNWTHPRRRLFRFRDKTAAFAGGLKVGKFRMKRKGDIMFATRGKRLQLRATDGHDLRVIVRVGSQCAQSEMSLRPKRKVLVFP